MENCQFKVTEPPRKINIHTASVESAKGEMRKMFSPVVYILDEFKIVCVPGRELVREIGIEEGEFSGKHVAPESG